MSSLLSAALADVPSIAEAGYPDGRDSKSGENSSRETLQGIWLRIYNGSDLIYEIATPESLRTTESW